MIQYKSIRLVILTSCHDCPIVALILHLTGCFLQLPFQSRPPCAKRSATGTLSLTLTTYPQATYRCKASPGLASARKPRVPVNKPAHCLRELPKYPSLAVFRWFFGVVLGLPGSSSLTEGSLFSDVLARKPSWQQERVACHAVLLMKRLEACTVWHAVSRHLVVLAWGFSHKWCG